MKMKLLFSAVAMLCFFALPSEAVAAPPDGGLKEQYILVGISGFKTVKSDEHDITGKELARDGEPSGAWDNLPVDAAKVKESYYLTHFQAEADVDRVLSRFDDRGRCDSKLGLIIMANSWGSNVANALAYKYYEKCGRLADFFIMVDGVKKPIGKYDNKWA